MLVWGPGGPGGGPLWFSRVTGSDPLQTSTDADATDDATDATEFTGVTGVTGGYGGTVSTLRCSVPDRNRSLVKTTRGPTRPSWSPDKHVQEARTHLKRRWVGARRNRRVWRGMR